MLVMTDAMRKLIGEGADLVQMRGQAARDGLRSQGLAGGRRLDQRAPLAGRRRIVIAARTPFAVRPFRIRPADIEGRADFVTVRIDDAIGVIGARHRIGRRDIRAAVSDRQASPAIEKIGAHRLKALRQRARIGVMAVDEPRRVNEPLQPLFVGELQPRGIGTSDDREGPCDERGRHKRRDERQRAAGDVDAGGMAFDIARIIPEYRARYRADDGGL